MKQSPYPHPMRSSTATWAGICRSRQKPAIRSSVVVDAAAYSTCTPHLSTISGRASITEPRSPRLPSDVTIWIVCDKRLPSIGLKTCSSVSPPTIMSTRLCRAINSCARK